MQPHQTHRNRVSHCHNAATSNTQKQGFLQGPGSLAPELGAPGQLHADGRVGDDHDPNRHQEQQDEHVGLKQDSIYGLLPVLEAPVAFVFLPDHLVFLQAEGKRFKQQAKL